MGCIWTTSIMNKIVSILPFLLLAALAQQKEPRNDDGDVEAITHIIMCACDDDGSGGISHEELNSDVCMAITQYEVPEEDFAHCDANGDGEIDFDEAMAWAMSNAPATRKIAELRENFFSDDAHFEAAVRVLGCVCDSDESWSLDMQEVESPDCQAVQNFMFGENCDQACFDHIDSSNDGELSGDELATALENMDNASGGNDDEDVVALTHIIMCACDDDGSGAISHAEATSDVCFAIHETEVPAAEFDAADTNGDGEIDFDEAMAWAMSNAPATRIAELRENFFSNDDHVEAAVRVLGCVCDTNGSYTLDMQEVDSPDCQAIQNFMFGENCDQACFDHIDSSNDGELDADEVATALEAMHEHDTIDTRR